MDRSRLILPIVLVAVGIVWVAQGMGVLRGGSFMVGDPRWALAGVALALFGAWLAWRRRSQGRAR